MKAGEIAQFGIDYTFFLNIGFIFVTGIMVWLAHRYNKTTDSHDGMKMPGDSKTKAVIALTFAAIITIGLFIHFII